MNDDDVDLLWCHHADGSRLERIADIVRRRAAATPDAPAVIDGERVTTFAELDRRSSQVGQALLEAGVVPGDRVTYLGANSAAFLEVLYGASKVGAIFAAVNNRLARPEVEVILRDAEPRVLVLGRGEPLFPEGDPATLTTVVPAEAYEDWIADRSADDPGHEADRTDAALIFYTSGTTGLPKGIVLSGEAIGRAAATMHHRIEMDETSVALAPIPYYHISGFAMAAVSNLNGGALLLDVATEPTALVRLLVERKVSHAVLVPTLIQRLIALPAAQEADWSALRFVVYGSAPMPLPVIQAVTRVLDCKLLQSYGLTESTGGVTVLWPEEHLPPPGREHQLRSVGRPMPGVRLRVVDPTTLVDLPPGGRGEVLIDGPGRIMLGYWRRPEETAVAFTPDGWLRTGDGGSLDEDGMLYLHDRIKDMIVTGGENVYPAEVESALTAHPAVAEVAVIGVPSAQWGESPLAVVVLADGASATEDEIVQWSRERLAHFKAPKGVEFVDVLPRNASGKLLKKDLRDRFRDNTF